MSAPLPLQDIHLPPAPGAWPPAPGWWLLAALLLTALGFAALRLRGYRRRRHRRRARLRVFEQTLASTADARQRLALLSQLLRRAARSGIGPRVATLAGDDWLRLLDGECAERPFSSGPGRVLLEGPFRAPAMNAADAASATTLAPVEALARRRYLQLLEAGDA